MTGYMTAVITSQIYIIHLSTSDLEILQTSPCTETGQQKEYETRSFKKCYEHSVHKFFKTFFFQILQRTRDQPHEHQFLKIFIAYVNDL